jgi:hypothetical protein
MKDQNAEEEMLKKMSTISSFGFNPPASEVFVSINEQTFSPPTCEISQPIKNVKPTDPNMSGPSLKTKSALDVQFKEIP